MDTVITFDPPSAALNTGVTNQFASIGLIFAAPPYNSLPASSEIPGGFAGNEPDIVAAPPGYAATQVAKLITPTEFSRAEAFGIFSGFHQHVKAVVGSFMPGASTVSLTAYDIDGVLVGSATGSVSSGHAPATLEAVSASATPNIAYFLIQSGDYSLALWIGELSYDAGASQPDFSWLTSPLVYVAQGASVTQLLTLSRFGNSNGDIQLAAKGLPSHVTAAFSPNPVTGSGVTTNLTITAAPTAAAVNSKSFTVSAAPASAAVGPQARTASGLLNVLPPFQLVMDGPTVSVLPCTPVAVMGTISVSPGFAGTIKFNVVGLPANASFTITPTSVTSGQSPLPILYLIISAAGGLSKPTKIEVTAVSGSVSVSVPLTLQPQGASITDAPTSAKAPMALQPGDMITITGSGFCPESTVRFGNDDAVATPSSITPTEIKVAVPRYATTGLATATTFPFGVIPPNGGDADIIPAPGLCEIDSFRNSVGLSFTNTAFGTVTMAEVEELFGNSGGAAKIFCAAAQAFVGSGDVCFGMCLTTQRLYQDDTGALAASFPPNLPISAFGLDSPDSESGPSALLQEYIRSQYLAQLSDEYLSAYLTFSVDNANGSSAAIRQAIANCLQTTLSGGANSIPSPDYPLVAMRQGLGGGHVVVAYDIVDGQNGDFDILVWDPNDPFTSLPGDGQGGEDLDATGWPHKYMIDHCTIHVTGSGQWSYDPQSDSGDVSDLVPVSSTVIPLRPTMLGTTTDLVVAGSTLSLAAVGAEVGIAFGPFGAVVGAIIGAVAGFVAGLIGDLGSLIHFDHPRHGSGSVAKTQPALSGPFVETVQVSNFDGRTLFGPGGGINRDPKWRLRAAPFAPPGAGAGAGEVFIVGKGDLYRHTVVGNAEGAYGMVLLAGDHIVVVSTNTKPGQNDEFTFDTRAGSVGFRTDADSTPLMVEVLTQQPDGSMRLATFATITSSLAVENFHFNSNCDVLAIAHTGPAGSFAMALAGIDADGGVVTFTTGVRQFVGGHKTTFAPADWRSLDRVELVEAGPLISEVLPGRPVPGVSAAGSLRAY